jgi:transcriptional regulator SbtR-like protein
VGPWLALTQFVHRSAQMMARDRGIRAIYQGPGGPLDAPEWQEYLTNVSKLIARAHEAGVLRKDIDPPSFIALLSGLSAAVGHGADPALLADILLAGLRAT